MKSILTCIIAVFIYLTPHFVYSQINVSPTKRCLVYGENSFTVNPKSVFPENDAAYYLKFKDKEFPLNSSIGKAALTAQILPEQFPVIDEQKLVRGEIIAKSGNKTEFIRDVRFSAVKNLNWEIIEKDWDDTPFYFQNGKIGIQPRRADHKANAADNTVHCLESVTFVDRRGNFEILKDTDEGMKKLGKYGVVNLTFKRKNFAFGKGKLIIKHFGNPATQEIPVIYYREPPAKVEVNLSAGSKKGTIKIDSPDLVASPEGSYLTYCPKGYFAEKKKENLRWDIDLKQCWERPVRINGDKKRFTDYTQTTGMLKDSDQMMVFNLKLTDGRVFKYLFTLEN